MGRSEYCAAGQPEDVDDETWEETCATGAPSRLATLLG
eukprot:CAMPEP_0183806630 /NCGR_PEP_ID=MMETSP0803_2-20130417/39736_1 /TAXON_ID=195967 /ORGANISM="Crustomastix stigmata, Strain CCMP3273" /LENGTH=37 /DNA_ID= /DNA_START= /DNA_END= /DNA_ORIENTATION=